jgi:hypothetical protein
MKLGKKIKTDRLKPFKFFPKFTGGGGLNKEKFNKVFLALYCIVYTFHEVTDPIENENAK